MDLSMLSSARQCYIILICGPLSNELIVIAVRRDTPTLWAQINAVIAAMRVDGRMEKLYAEWF